MNFFVVRKSGATHCEQAKTGLAGNTEKDPDDWVSGDEPMTGAQASYLKTSCEQAHTAVPSTTT
jgi:hypothetical protein